jgi:tartrate-resistant acid phosphatase type 5
MRRRLALALLAGATALVLTSSGCSASPGGIGAAPVMTLPATSSVQSTEAQATGPATSSAVATASAITTFAVIGDYGTDDSHERAVARLVASWNPAFIIAAGDDYYSKAGGTGTGRYDESTGAYYGRWLKDITTTGHRFPVGPAAVNAFFPALGNHDYSDARPAPRTYLTYFRLPGAGFANSSGNERYYEFVEGPVHFFVLNSNSAEPSGTSSRSRQAMWLKGALAASTSVWNVVYDHHPPYSSDSTHGSTASMRWPFAAWGADVVISGHAHTYERVMRNGIAYLVNGLGGAARYSFGRAVPGSVKRYRANWGAQVATASETTLTFEFRSVGGNRVDRYVLTAP